MPVQKCTLKGRSGWKWGSSGKCYIGADAKIKATAQGKVIQKNMNSDELIDSVPILAQKRKSRGAKALNTTAKYKAKPPIPLEISYNRALQKYVTQLSEEVKKVYNAESIQLLVDERNRSLPPDARSDSTRFDGWPEEVEKMNETMAMNFKGINYNEEFIAKTMASSTDAWNDKEWQKVVKSAVGVNAFQREPFINDTISSAVKENVALIKSIPVKYATDVGGIVQRGLRSGDNPKTIATNIQKATNTTKSRAALIARDQVSKLNGELSQQRQTNIGISEYTWLTAGDGRVRPTHASKNGKKFSWDSPPAGTGHPGQDFQCRCIADPDFSQVIAELAPLESPGGPRVKKKLAIAEKSAQSKITIIQPEIADWMEPEDIEPARIEVLDDPRRPKNKIGNKLRPNAPVLRQVEQSGLLPAENESMLRNQEETIRKKKVEYGFTAPANQGRMGRLFTDNDAHKVAIPGEKLDKIVSHNHPSGLSFSGADMRMAVDENLIQIRAVSENHMYTMTRGDKKWISDKDMKKLYNNSPAAFRLEYESEAAKLFDAAHKKGELLAAERKIPISKDNKDFVTLMVDQERMATETLSKQYAKRFGWHFEKVE